MQFFSTLQPTHGLQSLIGIAGSQRLSRKVDSQILGLLLLHRMRAELVPLCLHSHHLKSNFATKYSAPGILDRKMTGIRLKGEVLMGSQSITRDTFS